MDEDGRGRWNVQGNDETLQTALREINQTDRERSKTKREIKLAETNAKKAEKKAEIAAQKATMKAENDRKKAERQAQKEEKIKELDNKAKESEEKFKLETSKDATYRDITLKDLEGRQNMVDKRFEYENNKLEKVSQAFSETIELQKTKLNNDFELRKEELNLMKTKGGLKQIRLGGQFVTKDRSLLDTGLQQLTSSNAQFSIQNANGKLAICDSSETGIKTIFLSFLSSL